MAILPLVIAISSCEKKDCNGDLDGMWQLTEWTDAQGTVVATKEDMIFYGFQLQMMRFDRKTPPYLNCMSSFENMGDRIRIYRPVTIDSDNPGHDKVHEMSFLSPAGVPVDGMMDIDRLTSGELILSCPSTGVMKFRKY